MTNRRLQSMLRWLADERVPAGDAELLHRFTTDRDDQAFAAIVERYGRLVWAVCRHLTRCDADADDAFQATFLVLMRNATKIRDANRLSAWLHGTAYRICSKSRLVAKRRLHRETSSAKSEANGAAIPDSAWDRALAAVHEEVARLPATLRIPFILCCLEGKGTTEAANELGWKIGTFSGRLSRAKDAVAARLEARGVTLGIAVTISLAAPAPPVAAIVRAASWLQHDAPIPKSILQLTQGVPVMNLSSVKLLAAAILVGAGLALSGVGWIGHADAQPPTKNGDNPFYRDAQPKNPGADNLDFFERGPRKEEGVASTQKWDYDFVLISDMTPRNFVKFLQDRESRGWEYNGQSTLLHENKPAGHWVFRRPNKSNRGAGDFTTAPERITQTVVLKNETAQQIATLFTFLENAAANRYGSGKLKLTYDVRAGSIVLEGPQDAVDWAAGFIAKPKTDSNSSK